MKTQVEEAHQRRVPNMTEEDVVDIISRALEDEYEFMPTIHSNNAHAIHRRKKALRRFPIKASNTRLLPILSLELGSLGTYLRKLLGGQLPDFLLYKSRGDRIPFFPTYRSRLVSRCFRKALIRVASSKMR